MDLSFNRKSIFRKSFRPRHKSSSIPPAAACLMKSLNRCQSTRRSMKISSKLMRRNTDTEFNLKSGKSCLSPKTPPITDDNDKLLPKSPMLKRHESISKTSNATPSKWSKTTSPLKHRVSKVVSAMEKTIWNTPKKQMSKLFRRSSSGSFELNPSGTSRMDLGGSYKVLVFD